MASTLNNRAASLIRCNRWLVALCAVAAFGGVAFGQQAAPKGSSKAASASAPAPASAKKITGGEASKPQITILNATRVSTAGALHAAAEAKGSAAATHPKALSGAVGPKSPAADSGVLEFQTAAPGSPTAGQSLKSSKDSLLKNIHGDAYGIAGAAGSSAVGGAVGAKSKSGKTSIYVQTDHSQGVPPR